jgi:hypothetical protein
MAYKREGAVLDYWGEPLPQPSLVAGAVKLRLKGRRGEAALKGPAR